MTIELSATLNDNNTIDLNQPEFVGDGLTSMEEAREAAKDAIDYIGQDRVAFVDIIVDGEIIETIQ